MMKVVVEDEIVSVYVFRPWTVATQEYSGSSQMLDVVARDYVFLSM